MDVLNKLGIPVDEIAIWVKISFQTVIVGVGLFGNMYTIYSVLSRSKLPKTTNTFMISLSVALMLQTCNAFIDYVDHVHHGIHEGDYFWSHTACDTWHTLNVYLPMLLALHCFFCLLDRFVLLTRPEQHAKVMSPWAVMVMLLTSYLLPVLITVPPIYFEWYTTDDYLRWRSDKQCKFRTNLKYALISPIFTFWIPLALDAFIIVKMFIAMEHQDRVVSMIFGSSTEKLQKNKSEESLPNLPWKEKEMRRQHRLAITLWSVYWNVTLFWIPQHVWQFIYKITDADWPRATNFMAWAGYMPSLIIPVLYRYYNIYEL